MEFYQKTIKFENLSLNVRVSQEIVLGGNLIVLNAIEEFKNFDKEKEIQSIAKPKAICRNSMKRKNFPLTSTLCWLFSLI